MHPSIYPFVCFSPIHSLNHQFTSTHRHPSLDIVVVQLLSHIRLSVISGPSPSPRVCSNSCPLNQWCHPTISCSVTLSPLALSLSHHQVFSSESALCIKWPKYWSFSFSTSPANEYPGLISFRINWFDLLVVQGTLKSSPTLQFKSINSLVLSFLYGPTLTSIHDYWKTIALTRQTLLAKLCLCFLVHCLGLL